VQDPDDKFVTKDAAESFVCAPGWKPGT